MEAKINSVDSKLINNENTHDNDFNTISNENEIKPHNPHIFKESSYR